LGNNLVDDAHRPPRFVGTITLRDGRDLAFAEFGDPNGRPVLWLHGTPGSCRQVAPAAVHAAEQHGLRIIGVARPGAGASSKGKYANIAAFAEDAEQLADQLGLDRFGVVGLSGGGPYALSLGAMLGQRVAGIAVLGGVSPTVGEDDLPEGGAMKLAERFEPMLRRMHGGMASMLNVALRPLIPAAGLIGDTLFKYLPEGDRKVFETPGVKDMLIGDLALSITHGNGLHAMMQDVALFGRDWGFRLGYAAADDVIDAIAAYLA
jgi:pimeloyl-ACP methyl ester carboxylesterase